MKRPVFFMILIFILVACEVAPDLDEMEDKLVVYTDYASEVDFGKYNTYYMPDSILDAGSNPMTYWKNEQSSKIIRAVEMNMEERGYVRYILPEDKNKADLGLQISYLSKAHVLTVGGYWGGWWDYSYWGPWWGGWYYPSDSLYTYSTNSLVIELVDLTRKERSVRIPVVWYAQASGYQYLGNYNLIALIDAVYQAFEQSQYICRSIN